MEYSLFIETLFFLSEGPSLIPGRIAQAFRKIIKEK
jgi:hypothetical protein